MNDETIDNIGKVITSICLVALVVFAIVLTTTAIPREIKARQQCKAEGYSKLESFPAKGLVECCGVIKTIDGYQRQCKIFEREK